MKFTLNSVKKFWLTFLALLLVGLYVSASPAVRISAAPSWVIPVTPGGKAASPKDFSDGYYILFSDMQANLEKKTTFYRYIRQIASESGIQNGSEISVVYEPSYEQVTFHNIIVWRDGKAINQLNAADFKIMPQETDRQRFIYNGSYSASMILKDIRKGDKIEYSYSVIGWNSVFQNKYSETFTFGAYDYIAHKHYAIIAGNNRSLSFKDFNKPPARTVKKDGINTVFEWDVKNIKGEPYEDFTPYWFRNYAFVQITEFKSWNEVVNWGLQFYQFPALSGVLKNKVEEWKKASKGSDNAYIGLATRFVQDEVRYLGIETGENSHKPHNPEDVFNQRYGDCKDKAFLLCALLRANKIDANPLLVDTYRKSHLSEYLPTPADFNHVVVHVSLGEVKKEFRLIDATYSLQGGENSQIAFPDYGQGLLLKKGQNDVISLELQKPGSVSIIEEFTVPLNTDTTGKGKLVTKTVYFDAEADAVRAQFQQNNFSETEKNYLNYYRDIYKHAEFEIIDSLEYYDQREANNISLVERYSMKNGWHYDSTRHTNSFSFFGKMLYDQLIILPNRPRKNPVALTYPYRLDYTIRAILPDQRNIPLDSWEIKRASYEIQFSSKYIAAENVWELHYEYVTLKDYVNAGEVGQFKKDMEKLSDNLEYNLLGDGSSITNSNEDFNTSVILICLVFLAGCVLFFMKVYKFSPVQEPGFYQSIPIGGWLGLLGLGLVFTPFTILSGFFTTANVIFFDGSGWNAMLRQSEFRITAYHLLLVMEAMGNLFFASFAVLVIILFFKKRSSFPLLFSIFAGSNLLFVILDTVVTYMIFKTLGADETALIGTILRQTFYAAIWIPYLNKSDRVSRTFVISYDQEHEDFPDADATVINQDSQI
ncbi:DUF3857 domain-containing protein [Dyadobacter subterraneus]|uniref:DUF3857 domain-containing protein n=1 Tax=Dyadobacter subterraneus TaxID=2773304 RepID=A0ABR9WCU8_9BACT|nr:DUF3857 domain-containing protein [Dyadobacter subterraneus]MBE9462811.1 DUF3857 domain-containing protein [Dyadobacter subterraneus]